MTRDYDSISTHLAWEFSPLGLVGNPDMITVGVAKAKTHFFGLLDEVAGGEEVILTRYGVPIARLVAERAWDQAQVDKAFETLRAMRKTTKLGGLDRCELRDEGRR